MIVEKIQDSLQTKGIDGWLFFDHHRRDALAYRILDLPSDTIPTRRWYYFVPAKGEPRKLVHRIESGFLDSLSGGKDSYSSWSEQASKVKTLLSESRRVAMQYSPKCAIPYISLVDAGTIEIVRAAGVDIVSSANLVQEFEARWSDEQYYLHLEAGKLVDQVRREAFLRIGECIRSRVPVSEYDIQQFIRERFSQANLTTDHGPIVAVNANASDPHYEPNQARTTSIQNGDFVLIDMWAKLSKADSVYYDITWTGFCGEIIPERMQKVFEVVKNARVSASEFVIKCVHEGAAIAGFEVDDVARGYITEHGYGAEFFHRTGHSIGTEVHGNGANMDNLECHDDRLILEKTCFSIEPGIYLLDFGVRSEVNVFVGEGSARVTGEQQERLVTI